MQSVNKIVASIAIISLVLCSLQGESSSAPADREDLEFIILPYNRAAIANLLSMLRGWRSSRRRHSKGVAIDDGVEEDEYRDQTVDIMKALRPSVKRGLGHCIHNCINGRSNMNFIQCKSMCH